MSFYFSDFFDDMNVQEMDFYDIGVYFALLRYAWNADPPCTIPDHKEALRKILKATGDARFEASIERVLKCFKPAENGRLVQKRLKSEYEKARGLKKRRSEAGKVGRRKQLEQREIQANAGQSAGNNQSGSASGSGSDSGSEHKDSKDARARAQKRKQTKDRKHKFSRSAYFNNFQAFREGLADWPEEKAQWYYDRFVAADGEYLHVDWLRTARIWNARQPDEWKGNGPGAARGSTKADRTVAAVEAYKERLKHEK